MINKIIALAITGLICAGAVFPSYKVNTAESNRPDSWGINVAESNRPDSWGINVAESNRPDSWG
jgi:hypothetical protein